MKSRNAKLFFGAVFLVLAFTAVNPAKVLADCGVSTGSGSSMAGAIVNSFWYQDDGSVAQSNNTKVYVETYGGTSSPPGNLVRLDSSSISEIDRVHSATFNQDSFGCNDDGVQVVLGYGATSSRDDGTPGPWAIDCDNSIHGVGNEQQMLFTGSGVPSGARPGGSWSSTVRRPANGFTEVIELYYTQPPPSSTSIPAPNPPENCPNGNNGISHVRITWNPANNPSGTTGYIVDIDSDGNWANDVHWNKDVGNFATSTIAPDSFGGYNQPGSLTLNAGSTYSVRIYYKGAGRHSDPRNFTAPSCPPPSSGPAQPTVEQICSGNTIGLRVRWSRYQPGRSDNGHNLDLSLDSTMDGGGNNNFYRTYPAGADGADVFPADLSPWPGSSTSSFTFNSGSTYWIRIHYPKTGENTNPLVTFSPDNRCGSPPPSSLDLTPRCSGSASVVDIAWGPPPAGTAFNSYTVTVKNNSGVTPQWYKSNMPTSPRTSTAPTDTGYTGIGTSTMSLTGGQVYEAKIQWNNTTVVGGVTSTNSSVYLTKTFTAVGGCSTPVQPPGPTVTPTCVSGAPAFEVSWNAASGLSTNNFTVDIDNDEASAFQSPNGWWYRDANQPGAGPYNTTGPGGFSPYPSGGPALTLTPGGSYRFRVNYRTTSDNYSQVTTRSMRSDCTPKPPAPTVTPTCVSGAPAFTVNWNAVAGLSTNTFTVDIDNSEPTAFQSPNGWWYRDANQPGAGPYNTTGPGGFSPYPSGGPALTLTPGGSYVFRVNYKTATDNHSDITAPVPMRTDCSNTQFTITPTATIAIDDDESPGSGTFSAQFTITYNPVPTSGSGPGVKLTTTRRYYILKAGGATIDISPVPSGTNPDNNGGSPFTHPIGGSRSYGPEPRTLSGLGIVSGDRVCSQLTVNPSAGTVDGSGNVVSTTAGSLVGQSCIMIGSKPYFRVYGGDVIAGSSGFGTCVPNGSGSVLGYNRANGAGSAAQLAIQAIGAINGINSAAGRASTVLPAPPVGLNFAPAGDFAYASCNKDYYSLLGQAPASELRPPIILSSFQVNSNITGIYSKTNGDLTLTSPAIGGFSVRKGERKVIYVRGNVAINDNITYESTGWSNLNDIPSFTLVVLGNIYIQPGVSELNGTYIAQPNPATGSGGTIYTCASGFLAPNPATMASTCNSKLTVRGSFVAKTVKLFRTFGSIRDSVTNGGNTEPSASPSIAESFIFSPELYLGRTPFPRPTAPAPEYDSITVLPPLL